jgi:hypothetical protein
VVFFNFKGPWPFKFKTSDFSVLVHFTVAWLVNVAAATNFNGSGVPQDATTFICNNEDILLSGRQRQIGTAENQREIVQFS